MDCLTTNDWLVIIGAIYTFFTAIMVCFLAWQTRELIKTRSADILFNLKNEYTSKEMGNAVAAVWKTWRRTHFVNYEEFKRDFPEKSEEPMSEGEHIRRLIGNHFDKIGFLAKEGIIDPTLALKFVRSTVEIWKILGPIEEDAAKELGTGYYKGYFKCSTTNG